MGNTIDSKINALKSRSKCFRLYNSRPVIDDVIKASTVDTYLEKKENLVREMFLKRNAEVVLFSKRGDI